MHALHDAPRWTAAMWARWEAGEPGWKARPDGDDSCEVEWIARPVLTTDLAEFPELAAGRWLMVWRTDAGLDGSLWQGEPGRRVRASERPAPTAEEIELPF